MRDDQLIASIARQRGYDVAEVVTISAATYMPITLIVHTAATLSATAVVTPTLEHFAGHAGAVARALVLETARGTVQRSDAWDPNG